MNYKIKDLPASEQPYEKCLTYGPKAMSDAELLAAILQCGTKGHSADELAISLLKLTGQKGITGLHGLGINDLTKVKGIGRVKAIQIQCICEFAKRLAMAKAQPRMTLNNPASIAGYYMEKLRHEKQEHFLIVMFNSKNELITDCIISKGTINSSIASPREIFIEALKNDAVNIALLHNHPSGDVTPSREDKLVTRRIVESGKMLGIKVLDHIIIGDNEFYSFCEAGII